MSLFQKMLTAHYNPMVTKQSLRSTAGKQAAFFAGIPIISGVPQRLYAAVFVAAASASTDVSPVPAARRLFGAHANNPKPSAGLPNHGSLLIRSGFFHWQWIAGMLHASPCIEGGYPVLAGRCNALRKFVYGDAKLVVRHNRAIPERWRNYTSSLRHVQVNQPCILAGHGASLIGRQILAGALGRIGELLQGQSILFRVFNGFKSFQSHTFRVVGLTIGYQVPQVPLEGAYGR